MVSSTDLVGVDDLKRFAAVAASRELLPEVVLRLIMTLWGATTRLDVPTGSGTSRPGFDAIVEFSGTHPKVPTGRSYWEISNEAGPGTKANRDYRLRSGFADARTSTFVFITMRHWQAKREWAEEKRAEKIWADVRAYDCQDLLIWLISAPEVHAWLSAEIRRHSTATRAVPAELPADIKVFVGREEELAALAEPDPLTVICGKPGIGKSTLAVRAAGALGAHYPDGRLYLDLRGTHSDAVAPADALTRILRSLGAHDDGKATSTNELAARYRTEASRLKFVLVLDNARDEEQVRPLLLGDSGAKVIITSRNQLRGLDGARRIQLGTLSAERAVEMLTARITDQRAAAEPAALDRISALCGYLPLALAVVASSAMSRPPTWSLARLAEKLENEKHRLDRLRAGDVEVRASLRLSYELLTPAEQAAFRDACVIPGPSFGADLAGATLALEPDEAELILDHLVDRCLVEPADTLGRYRLHDLIRLFGKEITYRGLDEYQSPDAAKRARVYLVRNASRGLSLVRGSSVVSHLAHEHADPGEVRRWFGEHFHNLVAVLHEVDRLGAHSVAVKLCEYLCFHASDQSTWRRLDEFARLGLEITAKAQAGGMLEGLELAMTESLFNFFLAESATGRHDRRAASGYSAKSWLVPLPGVGGGDQAALVQQSQASVLRVEGRYEEALALFQAALDHWRATGRHDLYQVRSIEHDMGLTLMDMGRPREAIPHLLRDLDGTRAHGDVPEEAQTLNSLGLVQLHSGNLHEAEDALRSSAEKFRSCAMPIAEGAALNDLAIVLRAQGRHAEACEYHLRDLELCLSAADSEGAALALVGIADNLMDGPDLAGDRARLVAYCLLHALRRLDARTSGRTIGSTMAATGQLAYTLGRNALGDRAFKLAAKEYERSGVPDGDLKLLIRHALSLSASGLADAATHKWRQVRELRSVSSAARGLQREVEETIRASSTHLPAAEQ